MEHSAILSTFIKLPFAIQIFVLSNFEWSLNKCGSRGGDRGPDPPGKSQVIWFSIGNKQLDPPGQSWTPPPPLENVGPPLEPWKMIDFFENDHLTSVK